MKRYQRVAWEQPCLLRAQSVAPQYAWRRRKGTLRIFTYAGPMTDWYWYATDNQFGVPGKARRALNIALAGCGDKDTEDFRDTGRAYCMMRHFTDAENSAMVQYLRKHGLFSPKDVLLAAEEIALELPSWAQPQAQEELEQLREALST